MLLDDSRDYDLVSQQPAPLYLGSLPSDYRLVPASVVVNACGLYPPRTPPDVVVFGFPMQDDPDPSLLPNQEDLERFLAVVHPFAAAGGSYWHCQAGINRSSMLVAAYLHLYRGQTISGAIAELRKRRMEMVLCNSTFERTLREWYGTPDEQDFEPFSIEAWLRERNGDRAE